ncbi:MAG: 3'-5' exonuclease [Chitinophagaceae bacterium]|nr:MAG: 3'-5' exonuclease [Chitinophagaceae bacterium]
MIQLESPVCFLDLETTGTDIEHDRIVEFAICKLYPGGERQTECKRVNPWVPIPEAATAVHGITNEMVKDEPSFAEYAPAILKFISGCDLGGFNSNSFDFPMLYNEFIRAGIQWDYSNARFIDVGNLFKIKEPRTLGAAVKFYLGKELEDAHSAQKDIEATADVFLAQFSRYEDLPADLAELDMFTNYGKKRLDLSGKFTLNEKGDVIFNFGSHKGEIAADERYLDWMVNKAKFSPDTTAIARRLLEGGSL